MLRRSMYPVARLACLATCNVYGRRRSTRVSYKSAGGRVDVGACWPAYDTGMDAGVLHVSSMKWMGTVGVGFRWARIKGQGRWETLGRQGSQPKATATVEAQ